MIIIVVFFFLKYIRQELEFKQNVTVYFRSTLGLNKKSLGGGKYNTNRKLWWW